MARKRTDLGTRLTESATMYTNRIIYKQRENLNHDDVTVLKVNPDETVLVEVKGKCRIIERTGEVDEETGCEVVTITDELLSRQEAISLCQIKNGMPWCIGSGKHFEILEYDFVYETENGQLINGRRPRKKRKPAPKKPAAKAQKLRLAKVS